MSDSRRISRRTRGERPEVVPPKSDEEPDKFLEDDYVDEYGNKIALGALRGRRKRPAVSSSSTTTNSKNNANSNAASNKGPPHPQQDTTTTTTNANASNTATTTSTTKKRVRRQHSPTPTHNKRRGNNPTPSQSSVNGGPSRNSKRHPNTRSNSPTPPSQQQEEEESPMSLSVEEDDNGNDNDNADNDAENDNDDNKSSSSSSEVDNDDGDEEEESNDDNDCEEEDDDDDDTPIAILIRQASASSSTGARKKKKATAIATKNPRKVDVKKKKKRKKKKSSSDTTSPPLPPIEDDDGNDDDDDDDDEEVEKQLVVALRLKFDPARPYKCRTCGKLYASQGIKHHERKCMPVYSDRFSKSPDMKKTLSKSNNKDYANDDIDNDDNDNDDISSDASSSSPVEEEDEEEEEEENESSSSLSTTSPSSSHVDVEVVVSKSKAKQPPPRKKKSKKTTTTKTATTMYKCRNCNKEFSSRGITRHEKSCMTIYTRRNFPNSREGGGVVTTITSTYDKLSKSKSTTKAKDNDDDDNDNDEEEKDEDKKNDVDDPSDSDSVVVLPPKRKKRKKIDIHNAVVQTTNTAATAVKAKAAAVDDQEDEIRNVEEEEGRITTTENKKDNSLMTRTILQSSKTVKTTGIVATAGGTFTKDEGGGGKGSPTTTKNNNHNKGGGDESSISISTTTGKNKTNKDNNKNANNDSSSTTTSVAATTTVTNKKKPKAIDEFFTVKKKKKTGVVMKPPSTNTNSNTDQSNLYAAADGEEEGGEKAKKNSNNTKGKVDDKGVTTTTTSEMELSESESTTKEVVLTKEEESSDNEIVVVASARGAAVVTTTQENVTDNNSVAVNMDSTSSPPTKDDDDDDDDDGEAAESSPIHMITKTKSKTEEEKDHPMNKTTSTRPTRKRKLTPKAAAQQAAVAVVVATEATTTIAAAEAAVVVTNANDEERLFDDDNETDGDYGSDSVVRREKKEPKKSKDNDDDGSIVSANSGGGAPPPSHNESNNMEEEKIIGGPDDTVCTTTADKRNILVEAAKNAAAATLAALSSVTGVKVTEQTTGSNIEESALVHSESLNNEVAKDEEEVQENYDQVPRDDEVECLPADVIANVDANPTEVTAISTTIATDLNDVAMDVVNGNSSLNSSHQNASTSTTIDELGGEGEVHVVPQKSKVDNDKPPTATGEGESNNKKIFSVEETNVAEINWEGNHNVQAKSNEDNTMSTVLGEGGSSIKIIAVEKEDGRSSKEESLSSSTEDMNANVDSNVTNDETHSNEKPLSNDGTSNAVSVSVGHSTPPVVINGIGKEKESNTVIDEAIKSKGIVASIGSPYTSTIRRDSKLQIDIPASSSSIPNNAAAVVATTIFVSTAVGTADNIVATATDIGKAETESGENDGGSLSQPVLGKKRPRSGDVVTTTTTNTEESHPQTTEIGIANHVNEEEDQRREEIDIKARATDAKTEPICEDAISIVDDLDRSEKYVRDEKNVPNTEQSKITVEEIDRGTESLVSKKVTTDDSGDDPQQAGDVIETTHIKRKTDTTESSSLDEEQHDEDGTEGTQTQPKKRARRIGKDDNDVQNIIPDANADKKESDTDEISVSQNDEQDKLHLVEGKSRTNSTTNVALQVGVISETMNTTNVDDVFNVMADKPQIDQLQIAEDPSFNKASANGEVTTLVDTKSTDDGATEIFVMRSLDKSVVLADDGQIEFSDLKSEKTAENSSRSGVTSQVEKVVGCEGSKAVAAVDIQTVGESGTRYSSFKDNISDRNLGPAEESVVPTNDNDQQDTNTNAANTANIQGENVRNEKAIKANNLVSKTACDSDDTTMVSRDETVRETSVKVFGHAKTDESNLFTDSENKLKVVKEHTTATTDSGSLTEDETHRSDRSSDTHVSDKKTESMSQEQSKETEGIEEEEPESSREESMSNADCSSEIEKLATESIESGENEEIVANTATNDTHREDGNDIEANSQKQVPLVQTAGQDEHEEIVADGPHATGVLEDIESDAKTCNIIKSTSSKINSSQSDESGRNHAKISATEESNKTSTTEESNIADSDPVSSSLLASRDTDPIQMSASTAIDTLAKVVTVGANDVHVDGATHMDVEDTVDDTVDSMAEVDSKDVTRVDIETTDETRTQKEPLPETNLQIESSDETIKEDSIKNFLDSKENHLTVPNQKLSTENSTEVHGIERPSESRSASGILHDEAESTLSARLETETTVNPEESEPKVAWVEMSKAKRGPTPVEGPSSFNGFDESKMNRVKMLLYSVGSQIHRGRGFERIFSIYWDAVRLRLSGPQSTNISKQCDEAIAAFLRSKRLRKIHNRFIMGKSCFIVVFYVSSNMILIF